MGAYKEQLIENPQHQSMEFIFEDTPTLKVPLKTFRFMNEECTDQLVFPLANEKTIHGVEVYGLISQLASSKNLLFAKKKEK